MHADSFLLRCSWLSAGQPQLPVQAERGTRCSLRLGMQVSDGHSEFPARALMRTVQECGLATPSTKGYFSSLSTCSYTSPRHPKTLDDPARALMRMVQECGLATPSTKVYFSSPSTFSYASPQHPET